MSLPQNYKERYLDLLETCLILVKRGEEYESVQKAYDRLRREIDIALAEIDSPAVAERLLDKQTGAVKPIAKILLEDAPELLLKVHTLSTLFRQRIPYAVHGWDDDLIHHLDAISIIAKYQEMEKEILATLGREAGEKAILDIKRQVLPLERELGMTYFATEVAKMEATIALRTLISPKKGGLLYHRECLGEGEVTLQNPYGQSFLFERSAEFIFDGALYVELELLERLPVCAFLYYEVEAMGEDYCLTCVEDKEKIKALDARRDEVEVALMQEEIKKKKKG